MITRPKISRNEHKATEIGAFTTSYPCPAPVEAAVESLGERGQSVRGDPERLEALEVSDGVGETRQSVPRDPERRQVEEAADALG